MKPSSGKSPHAISILTAHFFRRFFDSDTASVQGDTVTAVVRALAAVAAPGLILTFFLQTQYPQRTPWGRIEDQYLFVLLSFLVMGAAATFEWEMLFPDRIDFLVMTPLSLQRWHILVAKASALAGFLLLFLFSANAFACVLLPAISKGLFFRQLLAQTIAVIMAGSFAALALLAGGGLLLCVLDPGRFRIASPLFQLVSVVLLTLMALQYVLYGNTLETMLSGPLGSVRWYPPFWFLGVYELLLQGSSAPAFAHQLAPLAYRALALAASGVALTYPFAWARMQRAAVEGAVAEGSRPSQGWLRLAESLVSKPAERAVFLFIGQTLARTTRYQSSLAIYGGLGLALAIACASAIVPGRHGLQLTFSRPGLYQVLPLTLFWAVAGLHSAFAYPLNLQAGWIFRLTGARPGECGAAARRWGLGMALALSGAVAALTLSAGWTPWQALVQLVSGLCLAVLLTDAFFFSNDRIPFNQPRMPGLTNFPLLVTLYVGFLPIYILTVARLEQRLEGSWQRLVMAAMGTVLIHAGLHRLRQDRTIAEEDLEGYDEGFQLLGLS